MIKILFSLIFSIPFLVHAETFNGFVDKHPLLKVKDSEFLLHTIKEKAIALAMDDDDDTSIGLSKRAKSALLQDGGDKYARLAIRSLSDECKKKYSQLKESECERLIAIDDGGEDLHFAKTTFNYAASGINDALKSKGASGGFSNPPCIKEKEKASCEQEINIKLNDGQSVSFSIYAESKGNGAKVMSTVSSDGKIMQRMEVNNLDFDHVKLTAK
ncbi:hypothetical protein AAEK53_004863 [Klebsiella aerogenes]